jgi:hypothetical protein
MAKSEIAPKLSLELQKGDAFTEPRVVYVLVQARKLLEVMNDKDFETLKFYCDWVLHLKLDRSKGASNVIKLFESIQKAADNRDAELFQSRSIWLFEHVLNADTFRNQLIDVLCRNEILPEIFTDDANWYEFLHHYGAIIDGVPLELKIKSANQITRVIVTRQEDPGLPVPGNRKFFEGTLPFCLCNGKWKHRSNHRTIASRDALPSTLQFLLQFLPVPLNEINQQCRNGEHRAYANCFCHAVSSRSPKLRVSWFYGRKCALFTSRFLSRSVLAFSPLQLSDR